MTASDKKFVTVKSLEIFGSESGKAVKEYVERKLDPLLERIAELESKTIDKAFRGVWREADGYASGSLVQHDGSVWLARDSTCGVRPGTSAKWVLLIKRGRDGKDGGK